MSQVRLTKRIEFAAAHRYHRDEWDDARNRATFGACHNAPGHGHNYLLEVTVAGPVDPVHGMVVNLYDLKQVLKDVLEAFDHKHLNLDTPYFARDIPTSENLAHVLWGLLDARPEIGTLERVRLYEDEDLFVDVTRGDRAVGGSDEKRAAVTRRYAFAAAHRLALPGLSEAEQRRRFGRCFSADPHGHNYVLAVTVHGPIAPETGMVVELGALDRLVRERVLARLDHRDLNRDPEFAERPPTGAGLVRLVWGLLERALAPGRLARIELEESPEVRYEYAGPASREPRLSRARDNR
ncbi:6-carboxytetrahydropterin synthase [Nitrospira sp. Kam-Ns4a]